MEENRRVERNDAPPPHKHEDSLYAKDQKTSKRFDAPTIASAECDTSIGKAVSLQSSREVGKMYLLGPSQKMKFVQSQLNNKRLLASIGYLKRVLIPFVLWFFLQF